MFRNSLTEGQLDEAKVRGQVSEMIAAKPRHYLGALQHYQRLLRLELQKHQAVIESAGPLPEESARRISQELSAKYGRSLVTSFSVDPDLIGGMRIRIGSDVWDASIRNRLNRLDQQFAQI